MKVNLEKALKNFDGEEVKDGEGKLFTFRKVYVDCLLVGEAGLTGQEKRRRGQLAKKIHSAPKGEIEFGRAEREMIDDVIEKFLQPALLIAYDDAVKEVESPPAKKKK